MDGTELGAKIVDNTASPLPLGGGIKLSTPPTILSEDQLQKLAGMVASQLQGIVKVATDDIIKGNFSGAWDDVKKEAINAGIADAIQCTRILEQRVMEHLATLGDSKQLDIAKGKMTDAFLWLGKHLGIGG